MSRIRLWLRHSTECTKRGDSVDGHPLRSFAQSSRGVSSVDHTTCSAGIQRPRGRPRRRQTPFGTFAAALKRSGWGGRLPVRIVAPQGLQRLGPDVQCAVVADSSVTLAWSDAARLPET